MAHIAVEDTTGTTFRRASGTLALAAILLSACDAVSDEAPPSDKRSLVVTATAYNSLRGQTRGSPSIAAWGDRLQPGMKAIAVSRDLLKLGLTHGTRVRIEGLPGEYVVLDKMAKRWTRKIDIYMGVDVKAARKWGRRRVEIHW